MKTLKNFHFISTKSMMVLMLVQMAFISFGQTSYKTFDIQKPFKKTTYDGKTFKDLRREGVNVNKDILKPLNDPLVNRYLRKQKAFIAMEFLFIGTSAALIGVGIAKGNSTSSNSTLAASLDASSDAAIFIGTGTGMLIPALGFGISAGRCQKKAIRSYNVAVTNLGLGIIREPLTGSAIPTMRMAIRF